MDTVKWYIKIVYDKAVAREFLFDIKQSCSRSQHRPSGLPSDHGFGEHKDGRRVSFSAIMTRMLELLGSGM